MDYPGRKTEELIRQQNLHALMRQQVEQSTKILEQEKANDRTAEIAERLTAIEDQLASVKTLLITVLANHGMMDQLLNAPTPPECQEMLKNAISGKK